MPVHGALRQMSLRDDPYLLEHPLVANHHGGLVVRTGVEPRDMLKEIGMKDDGYGAPHVRTFITKSMRSITASFHSRGWKLSRTPASICLYACLAVLPSLMAAST